MQVEFICETKEKFVYNQTLLDLLDKINRQKTWPTAVISQIEPSGLMHVRFNKVMKIPDYPAQI